MPAPHAMQALYDSSWHHPGVCWLACLLLAIALLRGHPPLRAFLTLFTIEIALDALFTGGLSPLAPGSTLAVPLSVLFVILGDLRFFLLLERCALGEAGARPRALARAGGLSLLVPALSLGIGRLAPSLGEGRMVFLVYELLFTLLTVGLVWVVLPRRLRARPEGARRFAEELARFELVQYASWAFADLVILAGIPSVGFALRFAPNVMYYALFLPYVLWRAPREGAS